jgi:hypothetical protein
MWDKRLAALIADYPSGILTVVEASGYPLSGRCSVAVDEQREALVLKMVPAAMEGRGGKACILFHMHNEHLEGLRQMVAKGELVYDDGAPLLKVSELVTANGREGTDKMPHAGAPLHMLQFLMLGRRKSKEYLAKRGSLWPPIPFETIEKAMSE